MPTTSSQQILSLAYELDEHLDLGRLDEAAALFANAILTAASGTMRGTEEVANHLRNTLTIHEDGTCRTVRCTVNPLLDVDDHAGTGSMQAYFVVYQADTDLPLQPILAGSYSDTFRRAPDGWQFASRVLRARFRGDTSHHHRVP